MSEIVRRGQVLVEDCEGLDIGDELVVAWEIHAGGAGAWFEGFVDLVEPNREPEPMLEVVITPRGRYEFRTIGSCPLHPADVGSALGIAAVVAHRELRG